MQHPFNFLNSNQVFAFNSSTEHYFKDWTKQFSINGAGVLFPKSTDEVQKIIQTCIEKNLQLVPSGGRTGLSGGAVATQNEWVLSLEKMNKILDVSKANSSITAQAGVVTKVLQEEALKHTLYFPVEFSATGSSLIGGNIATNAGGVHVVRYGNTRNWVSGLTVVTGKGDVLNLNNGLIKNNTGYDLRHLFIASEGTLGVVTEVEISLTQKPKEKQVVLLGLESLDSLLDCFIYSKALPLLAFELFTKNALEKVITSHSLPNPLSDFYPYYVLIELEISKGFDKNDLESSLEYYFEKGLAVDGTLSTNSSTYTQLWKYRELISETLAPLVPYKNDISVKISDVPRFINIINDVVLKEHKDLEVVVFGHIGDGNLHINTLKPQNLSIDDFVKKCEAVNQILFKEIKKIKGSISAEHGVGLLKKPYLEFSKSKEEIEYMKQIKKVFDPHNILNPGKIF